MSSATYMSSNNVLLTDFMQPLNLVFKHRLAKVVITITEYQNEFGGIVPTVTTPKFRAYTNIVRDNDGSTLLPNQELTAITPLFTREDIQGKHKFEVLIAPNQYNKQFTCVVNGVELTSSLPSNLEGGKSHLFNLTVGKEMLIFNRPQVTEYVGGWDQEIGLDYGPKVGEYLYSDGTWGALDKTKNPVGIIFSTQTDQHDRQDGYHLGYAISMAYAKEGDNSLFQYKTSKTWDPNSSYDNKVFGYKITLKQGQVYGFSLVMGSGTIFL
ncbi:MAG: fimbrillin family protein [Bacteroidales bacterium]